MYYSNAPLIEVIAEVRWQTAHADRLAQAGVGGSITVTPDLVASAEEYFSSFASEADRVGYRHTERLLQPGNPGFPGQAVVRFRREFGKSPLFQVGVGLFTANGVPPDYTGWDEFSSQLEIGLKAFLAARIEIEKERPFTSVSLRYIDAFPSEFWGDKSGADFISEKLGFSVDLPSAASRHVDATRPKSASFQVNLPIESGRTLQLSVGEGVIVPGAAVIMDSLIVEPAVDPTLDALVSSFATMHETQAESFDEVAKRLGGLLTEAK